MDPFMEKIVDANVCENLLDQASIENANMAEKIEMLENCIDEQRKQIENQQGIIRGLEKRKEELCDYYEKLTYENGILKAQMEVVRMIFGGRNDA